MSKPHRQISSCASVALDIKTYHAGQNQVTHPNVIDMQTVWHGYRYYMAYTPYPYANGSEENPCLAASNNLTNWETPKNLINPIACCEEVQCDELKDTHLLYRQDLDRLEMWYLGRLNSTMAEHGPLYCFRKTSSDGTKWSDYEILYRFDGLNLASESVIYHHGKYLFWGIHNDGKDIGLYYMESSDGYHWSDLKKCSVPQAIESSMWHGAVSFHDNTFYFVWVGNRGEGRQHIYLATSSDGIIFSNTQVIIENSTGWDFLYRPALLISNDTFYCFYGVVRLDNRWMIAMSSGNTPETLKGLTSQNIPASLERTNGGKKLQIKHFIHGLTSLIVPRLFIFVPFLLLLNILTHNTIVCWVISMLLCSLLQWKKFNSQRFVAGGIIMGTACTMFSTFIFQVFSDFLALFL